MNWDKMAEREHRGHLQSWADGANDDVLVSFREKLQPQERVKDVPRRNYSLHISGHLKAAACVRDEKKYGFHMLEKKSLVQMQITD